MAESLTEREELLRHEYHSQTARIAWHDLQTYYARGSVIAVSAELSLVDVAVQLAQDNTDCFQGWIANAQIAAVSEEQARQWYDANNTLWAVVAPPWVLVQER